MVHLLKSGKRYDLSVRRMIDGLHLIRGARKAARLRCVASKSWLHKWVHRLPLEISNAMILFTTGV